MSTFPLVRSFSSSHCFQNFRSNFNDIYLPHPNPMRISFKSDDRGVNIMIICALHDLTNID